MTRPAETRILPDWWLQRELVTAGDKWHSDKRLAIRIALPGLDDEQSEERAFLLDAWLEAMLPTAEPVKIRVRGEYVIDGVDAVEIWYSEPHRRQVQARYVALTEELFPGCHWLAVTCDVSELSGPPKGFGDGPLIAMLGRDPVAMLAVIETGGET